MKCFLSSCMSWNGAFYRTFEETVTNPNAQNGDVLVYDSAYDRWLPSSQAYQDNGTTPQIRHLNTSTLTTGVQSLDVETITTNGATLSLTQDTYFAPGITQPVGFVPNLYGLLQSAPTPITTGKNEGFFSYITVDSSLNMYGTLTYRQDTTPATYITNLDGTQTNFQLSNVNTTYGDAWVVSYNGAGQFQWAVAPVKHASTAIEVDGIVLTKGSSPVLMVFYFIQQNGGVDIYNGTTLVASNQFASGGNCMVYVVLDPATGSLINYSTVYTSAGSFTYWLHSARLTWGNGALVAATTRCASGATTTYPNQLYAPAMGQNNVGIWKVDPSAGTQIMANPIQMPGTSNGLYLGSYAVDSSGNLYIGAWVALSSSPLNCIINNLSTNASSGNSITLNANDNIVLMYNASGNFVRTLVQVNVGNTSFPQIESDGTNLWVYFSSQNTSLTVGGHTATGLGGSYNGYLLNITPTGSVISFVCAFDSSGLQTTFYGSGNRRMAFDSKNSLLYMSINSTGTATTGKAMKNMDGATSLVTTPSLGTARTEYPMFVLNTSTGKWQYAVIPFSVASGGNLYITEMSFTSYDGNLYVTGYVQTDQTSLLISDGSGNYNTTISTDPNARSTATYQPYVVIWSYNNEPMKATLPLPTPSTGNYLQKTLILQPNLTYVITEQNNAGNNV